MNREIKFRGKYSERHPWVFGHYYNNCDCGVNMDIIINHDENTGTGKEHRISTHFLGQFTGLKDKNGTDIYEGDIFKLGLDTQLFEVRFEHACFLAFRNGKQFGLIGELLICFVEVVGNIYENPELLQLK